MEQWGRTDEEALEAAKQVAADRGWRVHPVESEALERAESVRMSEGHCPCVTSAKVECPCAGAYANIRKGKPCHCRLFFPKEVADDTSGA